MTYLPPLVDAIPHDKRDGIVMQLRDYDIAVRILPLNSLESLATGRKMAALEREFNAVPDEARLRLLALATLTQAIRTHDDAVLQRYFRLKLGAEMGDFRKQEDKLRKSLRGRPKLTRNEELQEIRRKRKVLSKRLRYPLTELGRQLNEAVRKVQFVVWWNERELEFEPGLYCEDVATALAVLIFTRIASSRTLTVCQREGCGKKFIRTKQTNKFCSLRCGNTARKARERARKKEGRT